jgi:hypothetical protein
VSRPQVSISGKLYARLTTTQRPVPVSKLVDWIIQRELDAEERVARAVEQAERAGV